MGFAKRNFPADFVDRNPDVIGPFRGGTVGLACNELHAERVGRFHAAQFSLLKKFQPLSATKSI